MSGFKLDHCLEPVPWAGWALPGPQRGRGSLQEPHRQAGQVGGGDPWPLRSGLLLEKQSSRVDILRPGLEEARDAGGKMELRPGPPWPRPGALGARLAL